MEQLLNPEKYPHITREEVLDALRANGKENPTTMKLLEKYIKERRHEVEKITEKKAHYYASIVCSIENAELFAEAGYLAEAFDDLNDTRLIAEYAEEDELCDRVIVLMNEINKKINSQRKE
jgi:hypothetical protein